MRKVTREISDAFIAGKAKTIGNTITDGKKIWLHGNAIARRNENGSIEISSAGWQSNTTKERLNGLLTRLCLNKGIHQKNWQWYLNGKEFSTERGQWTNVLKPQVPEIAIPELIDALESNKFENADVFVDDFLKLLQAA
jgi:hypothetical protein